MSTLRALVAIVGLTGAAGLVIALGAPPGPVAEWALVAVAVIVLGRALSWLGTRLRVTADDAFERAAAERRPTGLERRSEMDALTSRVRSALEDPERLRLRLAPVLREIAAGKLAAHDLDLGADPTRVRTVLGDDVAAVLGVGGAGPPTGLDVDMLERIITSLEDT